jgi:membrane protein DedA with SNARE-associated domain
MRMLAGGPPPHPPGFFNALAGPLDHVGYWAVLLFVMIEDFSVPVPGETILIAAAVYAGSGRLNVLAVGVIGFAEFAATLVTGWPPSRPPTAPA